jgi:SWI/SNF-related matrix-associated actin-dependent regulator of chromatin subfamily A-like protein 1
MKVNTTKYGYYIAVNKKNDIPWIQVLEKAIYISKTKSWYIPKTQANKKILKRKGIISTQSKIVKKPLPYTKSLLLPECLYDVQIDALEFAYARKGNCILALDMGLGKTATSLCYTLLESIKSTVIICPASLKTQWASQIEAWLETTNIHIIYGQKDYEIPRASFVIINYEILQYHSDRLKQLAPEFIIIDEVQNFQNHKALRTKALYSVAKYCDRVMALSGTPITKSPVQFFPILHILEPHTFPTFFNYAKKYCNAKKGRYGWVYNGVSNLKEFKGILDNLMIRKMKKDSLDIPDKLMIPMLFDMDEHSKEYHDAEDTFLEQTDKNALKKSLVHLQYLAYLGKRKAVLDWISDTIKNEKLIIFCEHRKIVDDIYEYFKKDAVRYYGGMSDKQKKVAKNKFLDKTPLFVGNTTAAGTGLDGLQHVCHTVAFVELPWTSAKLDQATDRLWRSGQKSPVNVYLLLANDSIEQRMVRILDKSRKVVEQVVDGKSVEEIDFLKELVESA